MEQKMILRTMDVLTIVFLVVCVANFLNTFPLRSDSGISLFPTAGIISFLIILLSFYGLIKMKTKTYYFITYVILFQLPIGFDIIEIIKPFNPNLFFVFIISTSIFLILGIVLNYRRTGSFLGEPDAYKV